MTTQSEEYIKMYMDGLDSDSTAVLKSSLLALRSMVHIDAIEKIESLLEKYKKLSSEIFELAGEVIKYLKKKKEEKKRIEEYENMYIGALDDEDEEPVNKALIALSAMGCFRAKEKIKEVIERFKIIPHPTFTLAEESLKVLEKKESELFTSKESET